MKQHRFTVFYLMDVSTNLSIVHSERNHRLPTHQKREENKFGEYVCVRTQQSGDRTS